jgi:hypothetical protein
MPGRQPRLLRARPAAGWMMQNWVMCRSIKTLRPPFTEAVTDDDMRAAALQYVRKVSGFRTPAPHNAEAFERAVAIVTEATAELLATIQVRGPKH